MDLPWNNQINRRQNRFVIAAAICGLMAGIGDFLITFVLGSFYPGYNHLKLVMSELGTVDSPVALWINLWWILFGFLFIIFALGVRMVLGSTQKPLVAISLLIMVFGIGAGIGAGIFPMEPGGTETTLAGRMHGVFAGIGFLALVFVPMNALTIFPRHRFPQMHWLSIGVFVVGLASFVLFVAAEDSSAAGALFAYAGLWQRLFLLNHYVYLGVLATMMIRSTWSR